MPTYEYACTSCHHEWEAEQSIKEDALKECPACHQASAKRQISRGGGFILKGGGWYSDLYSSASNKPSGGTTASAEGTPAASKDGADTSTTKGTESGSSKPSGGSSEGSSSSGGAGGSSSGSAPAGGSGPAAAAP